MKHLKIALTGGYPPPYGGVSTYVMQLAENLLRDNFSIHVFAGNRVGDEAPDYVSWHHSYRSADVSRNLYFKIKKFKPEIIHSHQSTLDWRIGFVSKILGIPIVHHIHGERFPEQFSQLPLKNRLLLGFTAKTSTAIIAASTDLANFISTLEVDSRRIFVIPSLLPLEEHLIPDNNEFCNRGFFTIVTTGFYPFANLHYGFHLVPPVARKLREKGINFKWYLVGQAIKLEIENFQCLLAENGVQESVIYIGELERPQMIDLLRSSHIYLRTKYSDSFGIVIAEAHQLGCYCLFGDNNPYFQEGPRLNRYRTGDVDSLTEKLLEIISQITLDKPQNVDSPYAAEAKRNYEAIKKIYEGVVVKQ